ncbi:MAG TPA: hypothetical protein VLH08_16810 [Acidobacteriota bacterium]|nr:hypothetical protein [Acidobacteriota bacterium]
MKAREIRSGFFCLLFAAFFFTSAHAHWGNGWQNGMYGMTMLSGGMPYRADNTMLQMGDAMNIASDYMKRIEYRNLAIDEIEEWDFNYYVVVKEAAPSKYNAFELTIDKWTGMVWPEPGPNMVWNWKYCWNTGMMGGQCGNSSAVKISPADAEKAANLFLKQRFGRSRVLTVLPQSKLFYGYYSFDVKDMKTGAKFGMLSIHSSTGQVWYHTWHGRFIGGKEF